MNKISVARPTFTPTSLNNLRKVLKSGWVSSGPKTLEFEDKVRKYLKSKYVFSVNSCTNGIHAALIALNAKKNDEVLTPANTFISTINTLYNLGLKIKFCDVNKDTGAIDLEIFKKSITKKTKFFIPVHFAGNPINIKEIARYALKKKIKVIDDAATAFGSEIQGKKIGSFKNTVTVFSLHANKSLAIGEGGLISTQNKLIAKKLSLIINCGLVKTSWKRNTEIKFQTLNTILPGYKFNFNDILSSIAIAQLKNYNRVLKFRYKLKKKYISNLKKLLENKVISLPKELPHTKSSTYCFQIKISKKRLRNKLAQELEKSGISTTVYYTPANFHKFYKKISRKSKLPNTKEIFENSLSLPFHNALKIKDINFICRKLIIFFNKF